MCTCRCSFIQRLSPRPIPWLCAFESPTFGRGRAYSSFSLPVRVHVYTCNSLTRGVQRRSRRCREGSTCAHVVPLPAEIFHSLLKDHPFSPLEVAFATLEGSSRLDDDVVLTSWEGVGVVWPASEMLCTSVLLGTYLRGQGMPLTIHLVTHCRGRKKRSIKWSLRARRSKRESKKPPAAKKQRPTRPTALCCCI